MEKEVINKIEALLKIKILNIQKPSQGMDGEVFFVMDNDGKEYAIKSGLNASGDINAYNILKNNKVNIPVPKLFGSFTDKNKIVVVLEKINYPLLESVTLVEMEKYIPSMIANLKEIHKVKSDSAYYLLDGKKLKWKDILLNKLNNSTPDWNQITKRRNLDKTLILKSIDNLVKKINRTKFNEKSFSLLHTDFNQRNLFINPITKEITSIIDWSEAMFGDPIYDFARIKMLIWHFNLSKKALNSYNELLSFNTKQRGLEEIYMLHRIIEYLAYYSEVKKKFNSSRIKLHQKYLRDYKW